MSVLRLPCRPRELRARERRLVEALSLERAGACRIEGVLLESFDGRLARDGGLIERRGRDQAAELVWTDLDLVGERGRIGAAPPPPILAADLAPGPVSARLAALLGERALLPVGRLRRQRRTWHQRDQRGKLVLRVLVDHRIEFEPNAGGTPLPQPPQIQIEGLDGYEQAFARAREQAAAWIGAETDAPAWGEILLREAGLEPALDPSQRPIDLDPDLPAAEGYRRVFTAQLAVIEANQAGTRAALDTEFLHDLRVAVRRTRSLLAAASRVMPEALRARFATEFKWLGGETSALRDLDVYLLHFGDFVARAPRVASTDLEPLRVLLEHHQARERGRVAAALDSERARVLLDEWRDVLHSLGWHESTLEDAQRPLANVALEHVRRAERRVLHFGRSLDSISPDEDFHELRKRAKKLRYLLEFFGAVLDRKATRARISELKGLQDNLGEHQDRAVQGAALQEFARELSCAPPQTLLAMGFLVERLDEERRSCRAEFARRFAAYDRSGPRRRFREALEHAGRPEPPGSSDVGTTA